LQLQQQSVVIAYFSSVVLLSIDVWGSCSYTESGTFCHSLFLNPLFVSDATSDVSLSVLHADQPIFILIFHEATIPWGDLYRWGFS